jgi:pyridoxal phosphate enzyme (YggS family)
MDPLMAEPSAQGDLVAQVAARRAEVDQRIAAAADGRPVRLVAVTKTFPPPVVEAAIAAGLVDLGENYGQELVDKCDQLAPTGPAELRWHFIGGLQRNKIKLMAERVWLWQTIDRSSLVDELAKRVPGARLLIQVNTTGEAQKSGCAPSDAEALVDRARSAGLDAAGLMTVGPTGGADPRPAFDQLRDLAERCEVAELSMGMSADYEWAVEAGATMVRLGSVLFGPRSVPVQRDRPVA